MPEAHLLYSKGDIDFVEKPPPPDLAKYENIGLLKFAPIYYDADDNSATPPELDRAIRVFKTRRCGLLNDIQSATTQLEGLDDGSGVGYVAIGASVKLVKWALKQKKKDIVSIGVSGIKSDQQPTKEFDEYLAKKLVRLKHCKTIYAFDFADTGAAILKICDDIERVMESMGLAVKARPVAVGGSNKFWDNANAANISKVKDRGKILEGIPQLTICLQYELTKKFPGRNKIKNNYNEWKESGRILTDNSPKYQAYKQAYQETFRRGLNEFPLEDEQWAKLVDTGFDEEQFNPFE